MELGMIGLDRMGNNMVRRHHANAGKEQRSADAETTPLRHPEYYQYDLNLADIAEVSRRGSVIASWLLDLTALQRCWAARIWRTSKAGFQIQARVAGRSWRLSTSPPPSR